MRVSIMRHGEASFDAPSDSLRPLTPNGLEQVEGVVAAAKDKNWEPDCIWVSRLLRAQQTCAVIKNTFGLDAEEKNFLAPEGNPTRVLREISALKGVEHLVIVSHQPLVGSLVSLMQHGHQYEPYPYSTAELLSFSCDVPEAGLFELDGTWRPHI